MDALRLSTLRLFHPLTLALDAANRELIARFEKKIQATLARMWGESAL